MNDKEIISAIASRDERALGFAVEKYSKLLWKAAAPILVNASSAEDVEECVADVFIYLWQHTEKYDPSRGKLSSWLAMIARSRAIDRYRSIVKKREVSIEALAAEKLRKAAGMKSGESPMYAEVGALEAGSAAEVQSAELMSCINKLDEEEKELIVRRYYYEQKPKEMAEALDIPKKQLENKLYYTRQKLKKMMEERKGD